ncbi:MAG: nodulation protein NfeD [Gammaproteobacteria bacterium]|nr:MAG: nodulation protein NfeD [Gammaproteobacteria bacterium]UCH40005.1 MAG: nodulation protein NfeD [Gammaproteobacteria bacterium]
MQILASLFRLIPLLAALCITAPAGANEAGKAYLIEVAGAIGPVTQELVTRGIAEAEEERAAVVILQMDTPGGLDHSMREIIKTILDAHVPVVTWVSPQGSRAASAGTYILYASHVAAMAPATNLGAATPVQIGGLPKLPSQPPRSEEEKPEDDGKTDMERKILNDAIAYIKGLAKLRGRNEQWAEQAVREAASLSAVEALEMNVIDLVAADLNDLLRQLDGREINVKGRIVVLDTDAMVVERITPDWRSELLAIITNPNIAYVLMLIGIYGLILEFSNPGAILPGVTGAICLLLALYAFQVLPVNYAALALLAIGIAFMVSEIFVTSGGILGIGGVAAFTVGSIMLFDDDYLAVSIPMIGGTALVGAGFMLWILRRFATLRRAQVVSGEEYMIGHIGIVREAFDARGRIDLDGENWIAETHVPLEAGQMVRVTAVDKLVLKVEPVEESSEEE